MSPAPASPHADEIEIAVLDAVLGFDDPGAREAFLQHWFRDNPDGLAKFRKLLEASLESPDQVTVDARELAAPELRPSRSEDERDE